MHVDFGPGSRVLRDHFVDAALPYVVRSACVLADSLSLGAEKEVGVAGAGDNQPGALLPDNQAV